MKKPKRLVAALAAAATVAGGLVLGLMPSAAFAANGGAITSGPTPNSGIVAGTPMSVTYTTGASDSFSTGFVSFVQCGNADSSGNGLSSITGADCVGTENVLQNGAGGAEAVCNGQTGVSGCVTNPSGQPGITGATPYTANLTSIVSGIGSDSAKCLPTGGSVTLPCQVIVQEIISCTQPGGPTVTVCTSGFGPVPGSTVTATYTAKPVATLSITSVSDQNGGTGTARPGTSTITLSGTNWSGSVGSVQLCTSPTTCSATPITGSTLAIDGTGALSGTVGIASGTAAGADTIQVTDSLPESASTPIVVLGAPAGSISPTTGGPGTIVGVSGSDFDANAAISIVELASLSPSATPLVTPTVVTSTATGALPAGTAVTVTDPTTAFIVVSEVANPTTLFFFAPFTFSANSCTAATTTTDNGCSVVQTVNLTVTGTTLTISQTNNQITMSPITLNGFQQTSTGNLNTVGIVDARGTLTGWSETATLSSIAISGSTTADHFIVPTNMSITPACSLQSSSPPSGILTEVTTGASSQAMSSSSGAALCSAASGGGGGAFNSDASLSLIVPASIAAGPYTATLTILVS